MQLPQKMTYESYIHGELYHVGEKNTLVPGNIFCFSPRVEVVVRFKCLASVYAKIH